MHLGDLKSTYIKEAKVAFGCALRKVFTSFVTVVNTDQVGNNYRKSQRQVKGSLLASVT